MAESTYYAWAPIVHKNEKGSSVNLAPGDEVTNDFLSGIDKDTRKAWIRDGVIRKAKFPKGVPEGLSVRTHLLREANKAFEEAQKVGNIADPEAENPSEVKPNSEPATPEQAPTPAPEGATQ
jgi:hypothetical protein